jgi:hypothetical protein
MSDWNAWEGLLIKKNVTPRPGFEPGSEAPEAPRISTTLPGHVEGTLVCLSYQQDVEQYNNCGIGHSDSPEYPDRKKHGFVMKGYRYLKITRLMNEESGEYPCMPIREITTFL